jgi:hypothetical protein
MGWAELIGIIGATILPLIVDMFKALVDGDEPSWERVSDRIPATLRTTAKLEYEKRRLEALKERENG